MSNAVFFVLGAFASLYTNLIASRLVAFREHCVRAIVTLADFARPDSMRPFLQDNWMILHSYRPVMIGLMAAGQKTASQKVDAIAKELTTQVSHVLTHPPENEWTDRDHTTRFLLNANQVLSAKAGDLTDTFAALPKNWWAILKPWI
jgi:hypothetical protein